MTNQVISAIKGTARVIGETYRLGFRAWWAAPAIVAIAVVPEFIQHVVEIRLGMFDSLQRFSALSQDQSRWIFGYAKVAGLVIAMLAIARFWAVGSVRKTFAIALPDLGRLVLAVALAVIASLAFDWLGARRLPAGAGFAVSLVSMLVQAGLAVFVVAALVGDHAVTLRTAFTERWPTALVLAITVIVAFVPAQVVHMFDHRLALGKPIAVVWGLMLWDSLVVGLISTLAGSALWAAYRSGATWRGWAPDFLSEPEIDAASTDDVTPAPAASLPASAVPPAPAVTPAAVVAPAPTAASIIEAPRRRRPRPGPRPRG